MAMCAATMRQAMKRGGATTLVSRAFNSRFLPQRQGSIVRDIRSKRRGNLQKTTNPWDAKVVASTAKENVATEIQSPTAADRERSKNLDYAISTGDRMGAKRLWHEHHADVTGRSADQTTDTNSSDASNAKDTGPGPAPPVSAKSVLGFVDPYGQLPILFPEAYEWYNEHVLLGICLGGAILGGLYGAYVFDQVFACDDQSFITNLSIRQAGLLVGIFTGFAVVWTFPHGLAFYGAIMYGSDAWRNAHQND